jgi:hypothetical protein
MLPHPGPYKMTLFIAQYAVYHRASLALQP